MRSSRKPPPKPTAAVEAAEDIVARNARLEAAALDRLARMGDIAMRLIERIDRRSAGQMDEAEVKAFSRVGDDCNAFVRMSRSVRQIIVLEHEIAGLRQPPVSRADAGRGADVPRAANGNRPGQGENLRTADDRGGNDRGGRERGDRNDLSDPDEDDDDDYDETPIYERVARVCEAVMKDLAGTVFEDAARRDSPKAKFTKYSAITPHPALDAYLAELTPIERGQLYAIGLGQGPPPDPETDWRINQGRRSS